MPVALPEPASVPKSVARAAHPLASDFAGAKSMSTLEVVGLPNGRYGVQAVGSEKDLEAGEFDTREDAEEWIFERAERFTLRDEPNAIIPGGGQGPR